VLRGALRVEHDGGALEVKAGEAVLAKAGERVRYSTPGEEGAEYVAICLPAFSPQLVRREA
jgi:ethanolamine utilization protein EutQ (cupin superfamily)